jgi:hypothetical protein
MCVYIVDIEDQFKFSFPSHMLMEELDAQRSDLLSYYFEFVYSDTLYSSVKFDKLCGHVHHPYI